MTEAAAVHLLIGGGWVAWVVTGLHGYMLVWLWGFLLGPRAYPHRIGPCAVVLRSGPLYRARVPLDSILSATARTERVGDGTSVLHERDGTVLLAARGRVDVWLELSEPVGVQRALAEPVVTSRIAIASDDPAKLVEGLLAPAPVGADRRIGGRARLGSGLIGAIDIAGITRDVAQHG